MKDKIFITTGDPNGIGAEITIKALKQMNLPKDKIVLVSNSEVLEYYGGENIGYELIEIPYNKSDIIPGKVTKEAGEFSYLSLKMVCDIKPKAVITAPVSKTALNLAGHNFSGQTEVLEKYLAHDGQKAEMLFIAEGFRVLLLTRQLPIKSVNLTKEFVVKKIENLNDVFKTLLKIDNPKFALCGFNPHAGEDGLLGQEELEILIPAVEELTAQGISITNPKPSDTLFVEAAQNYLQHKPDKFDCYIANYHDQGLIPIKTVAGMNTVNTTIGLDVLRTSPGHGTAFDIAGKNIADSQGMISAIKTVIELLNI